jgi:4-amino-4-deoxy-L-arabinose transferase-like glycosyltransferase
MLVATVLAAALRFYNLSAESIWYDESISIQQASLRFGEMIRATWNDNYPPLHNIFLFPSLRLFDGIEFSARLPSVFFGVLTVPAIYAAGRELFGRSAGVAAAILVAAAPFQIEYAQEARMYSILAFFAALSFWLLLRDLRLARRWTAIAYVLATAVMLYTQFYALFALFVENLFFLVVLLTHGGGRGRRLIRWVILQLAVIILFLPWLPSLLDRSKAIQGNFWIPIPTLDTLKSYLFVFAGSSRVLYAGLAVIAVAVLALSARRWRTDAELSVAPDGIDLSYFERLLLPALWLLVPMALGYALSHVLQPFLMVRYVIAASLGLYLLMAAGVAALSRGRTAIAAALSVGVVALNLQALGAFYSEPRKHDWRGATALVLADLKPGDVVLPNPYYEDVPIRLYARGTPLTIVAYPGDAGGAGRRWVVSEVANDECWADKPGPVGSVRPLLQRTILYQAAVCLYGEPTGAGQN